VLEGTIADLTAQTKSGGFGLVLDVLGGDEQLMKTLEGLPGVESCHRIGNEIVIQSKEDVRAKATAAVIASGASLLGANAENKTLEEIYMRYFASAEE